MEMHEMVKKMFVFFGFFYRSWPTYRLELDPALSVFLAGAERVRGEEHGAVADPHWKAAAVERGGGALGWVWVGDTLVVLRSLRRLEGGREKQRK